MFESVKSVSISIHTCAVLEKDKDLSLFYKDI